MFEYIVTFGLLLHISHSEIATLYEDIDFKGSSLKVEYNGCYNLPGEWNDRVSSINTHGMCIRAWEHGSCQGKSIEIAPGTQSHSNLVPLGFNDFISSMSSCGQTPPGSHPQPTDTDDWRQSALNLHNKYRQRHGVPKLLLDNEVNRSAQRCAEYLAGLKILEHKCKDALGHSYGENLAKRFEDDPRIAALESTKAFYSEESKHDYNDKNFQYPSGHFSQVIWKNSKKLGLGFARNGDFKVIVAHYDPSGNFQGQFIQNVPRPIMIH